MNGKNTAPEFSLYFHIPFCTRKCDYCHFYVLPDKESLHEQLLEALIEEWQTYLPLIQGKTLASIYFGGGTPSLFGPKRIEKLLKLIEEAPLSLSSDLEITLEANPERITPQLVKEYAATGINRMSIGVQSLDAKLLKLLGRLHDPEMAKKAIHTTFENGVSNISIDLMYDLPHQTLQHWEQTLDQVKELPLSHLSLYNLTIEPHTVFFKKRTQLTPALPDSKTSQTMYELAIAKLESYGLEQYEISAFAKPGYFSKHNTGYWTGRPFLGLGPSAFSFWEGKRFRNVAHLNKYHSALKNQQSPVDFEEKLETEAHKRELLVIKLRMKEGVFLPQFESLHGALSSETQTSIQHLIQHDFLCIDNQHLKLTFKGILCYDSIASELI